MRLAMLIFGLFLAMFVIAGPTPTFAQTEDGCADALDNDDDGFVNDGCPAVGLSEAPEVTASPEPVASPTDAPTAAPTIEPTATPTGLPDTGGDPGDTPAGQDGTAFTQWVTEIGGIGIIVTFLALILNVMGITASPLLKRVAPVVISLVLSGAYISMRDNVKIETPEDVLGIGLSVLVISQIAYTLAAQKVQEVLGVAKT